MKQAEFLNLDTKQVQWLDASLEHPNLVKVPEGAQCAFEQFIRNYPIGFFKDGYVWSPKEAIWKKDGFTPYGASREIVWQRNPLQQKINETLSALNVSNAQLSVLLGREKSYVKRLLAKGRNVTENTKVAVIDQLEQLIRVHEYEQETKPESENTAVMSKPNAELGVSISDHSVLQFQLNSTKKSLELANKNSLMWQKKYKDQKNLILFLTLVVVVMAFVWVYSVLGV